MSSLVMVVASGLLPAILPCHAIQLGIAGGKARVPSKRAASGTRPKGKAASSRRTPKGPTRKMGPTTTDFAQWRDWRQVRVVISRRGHDISCPYWCLEIAENEERIYNCFLNTEVTESGAQSSLRRTERNSV